MTPQVALAARMTLPGVFMDAETERICQMKASHNPTLVAVTQATGVRAKVSACIGVNCTEPMSVKPCRASSSS